MATCKYITLLLCLTTNVWCQRTISHITEEQIRNIGSQVDLECSVHDGGDDPVLWLKYDQKSTEALPLSTSTGLIIRDPRFSFKRNAASNTYTLSIKDIQETDAGMYQCQVIMSASKKITAEVELKVRRPPIIFENSTHSLVASEGKSALLECHADGFPQPKISWRRENNVILPTGGSIHRGSLLQIQTVHKEDRGTYYCVAENGVGKGARRNINLEVEFAPVVTVPRPRQGQALQYDIELECHVEAFPAPSITWLKDEAEVANNQHYSISHLATADEFTDTTLRVITIEKRQYGMFTCKAQNKLGSDEGQVELFVWCQRTPTISHITQEQIRDIGSQVDLECSVHYAQDYPVLWLKYDRHKSTEALPLSTNSGLIIRDSRFSLRFDAASATYTLSMKDIQETDAGWYQCQVIMSVSNKITAEVELQVRRPPIISDNSTRSLVASEGETAQMECYAGGFPPPKISWRRENNAILPTGGSIYRGNLLKISSVHKEDRGTYYCVAENGVGKGARRNINLEVEFAPVVTVPRPRLGQALQYDMDLECHVEAYPPPAIVWLKGEFQLSNNQHYSISHFATADEFTDTTLRVITIEKRQYGMFTCKAQNKLGSDEGQVELFETIIPVCPPACGQTRYGGGAASIAPSAATTTLICVLYATHLLRRIANTRY